MESANSVLDVRGHTVSFGSFSCSSSHEHSGQIAYPPRLIVQPDCLAQKRASVSVRPPSASSFVHSSDSASLQEILMLIVIVDPFVVS